MVKKTKMILSKIHKLHHRARRKKSSYKVVFSMVIFWAMLIAIFSYVFPVFIEQQLGSLFLVGVVTSMTSLISLVTNIPFGFLAHRTTLRKLLVVASSVFVVVCTLAFFAESAPFVILIFMALLYGTFWDLFEMSIYLDLFRRVKSKTSAQEFATRDIVKSSGLIVGYIAAGILLAFNSSIVWQVLLIGAIMLVSMVFIFLREKRKEETSKVVFSWQHTKKVWKGLLRNSGLTILFIMVVETIISAMFFQFAPIYFHDRIGDVLPSDMWGGLIFAAATVPFLLLALPISRKLKPKRFPLAISLGIAVLGAGFIAFSLSGHYIVELIVMIGAFVGHVLYWPAAEAFFQRCSEQSIPDNEGEDIGIFMTALNIGYFLGPLLGGIFLSYLDFPEVIRFGGFVLIILAIFAFIILRTPKMHGSGYLKS